MKYLEGGVEKNGTTPVKFFIANIRINFKYIMCIGNPLPTHKPMPEGAGFLGVLKCKPTPAPRTYHRLANP